MKRALMGCAVSVDVFYYSSQLFKPSLCMLGITFSIIGFSMMSRLTRQALPLNRKLS